MQDLLNSVKANLYDRVSSPLSGTFIVAFILHNYKLFMAIFSDLTYYEKIKVIDKTIVLFDSFFWGYVIHFFIIPGAITLIYLFTYPIPSKFFFNRYVNEKSELVKYKNQVENGVQLTYPQSVKIRNDIANMNELMEKSISQKERIIASREESINNKDVLLSEKDDQIQKLQNKLSDCQSKLSSENERSAKFQADIIDKNGLIYDRNIIIDELKQDYEQIRHIGANLDFYLNTYSAQLMTLLKGIKSDSEHIKKEFSYSFIEDYVCSLNEKSLPHELRKISRKNISFLLYNLISKRNVQDFIDNSKMNLTKNKVVFDN
ncbi:hypothetical protein [Vibrio tritonius]|uniref:hypothetical protein n=1 Tax=Vibrio tritonius TaxID=1435069 RepID=UPI0008393A91|nr:hypothetical protein [Vibrio tritonius]